jgi:hypothetical protein
MLLSPQSLDPLVINPPTISNQLSIGALAAKTGSLAGNPTHLHQELGFIPSTTLSIPLRVAVLVQHPTSSPLRNFSRPQTTTHFCDCTPASFGAHQFPLAASRKISMSKAWFATTFFKRAFSC